MTALNLVPLLLAANPAMQVGSGKLQGGWEYVWMAYAVFWGGLALYGISLLMRSAAERQEGEL